MKHPKRKALRLKGYDYSQIGTYFLTICSKNRQCIFSRIVGCGIPRLSNLFAPIIELSEHGMSIENTLDWLDTNLEHICVDKYVIMPNHVHIILMLNNAGDDGTIGKQRTSEMRPSGAIVPKFISSLKRYTNKLSNKELWQSGYYDHIIRDESDYLIRCQYIDDNPARWLEDEYYIEKVDNGFFSKY